MIRTIAVVLVAVSLPLLAWGRQKPKEVEAGVSAVLDDWHKAAAAADEERYFGHFTADALMFGTDATERWTRDEFRTWAKPHFDKETGWKFKSVRRAVTISKDGAVAWFDEDLATEKLGPCRGSGMLVAADGQWKIAQYVLSVPVPNEAFADVKRIIETALQAKERSDDQKKDRARKGTSDGSRSQNYGRAYAVRLGKGTGEWTTYRGGLRRLGQTPRADPR